MLIIILTFYSCGGFKEAGKVLRNEKLQLLTNFSKKKGSSVITLITTSYPNLDH